MDKEYEVSAREIHFITTGGCFHCIFGEHYNEGYLAIINWGIATTIAPVMEKEYKVSSVKYNSEQIYKALSDSISAQKYFPNDDVRYKVSIELAEKIANEMII